MLLAYYYQQVAASHSYIFTNFCLYIRAMRYVDRDNADGVKNAMITRSSQ